MSLPLEIVIALITGGTGAILSSVALISGHNNVKDLREIIDALRERVDELEVENNDLKAWAEGLMCQVREAGIIPLEFIRTIKATRRRDDPK